jgi:N-acetylmuramoyl-L-alanine amidase
MSLWRIYPALTVFGLLPAFAAPNSGLIQVTSIRSWSHTDSTRVVIQTSGPFEFRSDRARNPDRLFFDILRARPWIAQRRFASHEIGDKLVRRVRIAETAPGTTRIVFDLVNNADYNVTKLEAPDRMVIEFRPINFRPLTPVFSSLTARAFLYPPPPRRPQIVMPGLAPSLQQQANAEVYPFYFADPLTMIALSVKPPRTVLSARTLIPRQSLALSASKLPPSTLSPSTLSPSTASSLPAPLPSVPAASPSTIPPRTSAALASENASRSLTRALGLKVNRIVIDAGHGGHDDGTIGPHGVLEKDVVLDVALRLSKLVQERLNAEVVLTRSDDTFIPLHSRTAIANERKADLFLSIHANSSPAPEVAGTETFFLNFTNSPEALNVAARENAGSDKSVGELKDLIQSITLNDKIEESHTFAQDIQNSIQSQAAKSNAAAHNRGVKRAPFVVLIGASMPSVLAEIGFLSNSRDENNLNKPEYRQKIAEALYKGLAQYAQSLSHFEAPRQLATTGLN